MRNEASDRALDITLNLGSGFLICCLDMINNIKVTISKDRNEHQHKNQMYDISVPTPADATTLNVHWVDHFEMLEA